MRRGCTGYRLADKQEAFSVAQELGFQYLMAMTAGAYFAGASWPERIWEAFAAAMQSVQENPTVSHVGYVDSYAVRPSGIQRVEDSPVAFTIFRQQGYQQKPRRTPRHAWRWTRSSPASSRSPTVRHEVGRTRR